MTSSHPINLTSILSHQLSTYHIPNMKTIQCKLGDENLIRPTWAHPFTSFFLQWILTMVFISYWDSLVPAICRKSMSTKWCNSINSSNAINLASFLSPCLSTYYILNVKTIRSRLENEILVPPYERIHCGQWCFNECWKRYFLHIEIINFQRYVQNQCQQNEATQQTHQMQ